VDEGLSWKEHVFSFSVYREVVPSVCSSYIVNFLKNNFISLLSSSCSLVSWFFNQN